MKLPLLMLASFAASLVYPVVSGLASSNITKGHFFLPILPPLVSSDVRTRGLVPCAPLEEARRWIPIQARAFNRIPWRRGYIEAFDAGEFGGEITFDNGERKTSSRLILVAVSAVQLIGDDVLLGAYNPMISSPNSSIFIVSGRDWPPHVREVYRSGEDILIAAYYDRREIVLKTKKYLFWLAHDGKIISLCARS